MVSSPELCKWELVGVVTQMGQLQEEWACYIGAQSLFERDDWHRLCALAQNMET